MKDKKKIIVITVLVIVILVLLAVIIFIKNKDNKSVKDTSVKNSSSSYKIENNSLSKFDLYFLGLENNGENKVYSPLSIKYTLSMLENASSGTSKTQIENIIGDYKAKKYTNTSNVSFANGIFVKDTYKKKIKEEYVSLLKEKYNAEIIYDAFKNTDNVNEWVSNKTLGLIPNILDSIDNEKYFLINTLGIDMDWIYTIQPVFNGDVYDKEHSTLTNSFGVYYPHINYGLYVGALECGLYRELEFNNKSVNAVSIGSSINNYDIVSDLGEENIRRTVGEAYEKWVLEDTCNLDTYEDTNTFLNSYISELNSSYKDVASSTDYTFYVDDNMKVFQKELKSYNDLSLEYIAFMPRTTSLDKYIKNIDIDELNTYISKLKSIELNNFEKGYVTKVTGLIPLFEFDYELNLQDDLEKLGITDVFIPDHANLINMTKDKGSYISSVNHKANITFSNEGIKAAAATSGGGDGDMSCNFEYLYDVPVKEIDITFDKPYLFLIRDKNTKEVWFTGSVYEPTLYNGQIYCAE